MPTCPFCEKSVAPGSPNCPNCGAGMGVDEAGSRGEQPSSKEQEIRSLLQQGRTIEAIRVYREQTGAGLKEAKDAVEAMMAGTNLREPLFPRASAGGALDIEAALLRELREGNKIAAIKMYRDATHAGLKDAKDAVEALAARHGLARKPAGCLGMLLFWFTLGCAILKS